MIKTIKKFTNRNVYPIMEKKIEGGERMKITLKALRVNAGYTMENSISATWGDKSE